MAKRTYVEVEVFYDTMGRAYPKRITFKGVDYPIDRILGQAVDAPALLAGGQGKRYTVRIGERETHLFMDDQRRWFVEEREPGDPDEHGSLSFNYPKELSHKMEALKR